MCCIKGKLKFSAFLNFRNKVEFCPESTNQSFNPDKSLHILQLHYEMPISYYLLKIPVLTNYSNTHFILFYPDKQSLETAWNLMLISFSVMSIEIQEYVATNKMMINSFKSIRIHPQALLSLKLFYSSTKTDFPSPEKKPKQLSYSMFWIINHKIFMFCASHSLEYYKS